MSARLFDLVYVTKARAIEAGLTHEGCLYGVPAWLRPDGEDVIACPKLPILHLWVALASASFDLLMWLVPAGQSVEMPIRLGNRIVSVDQAPGREHA